ncbi:MAG: fused MFS/spermidine synthase [Candidatus Euphemobacter frigidus]|nr:fused MFS/spermidine synthase [Candidatus Euphemobacter frigidus]MDP8275512.1 fused MFS/spermidine synthase [Candidatus Euphemobacter frigidus]
MIKKYYLLFFSVFVVGFTSLSAQIVFLRELLVLFYGNELSLGVVLGCWLFWTGMGSLLLGRLADRFRSPAVIFSLFQSLLAVSLVLTLLAIRSVKLFLNVSPGQIIGYLPIIIASFTVVSLYCLLNGFLFSLGCKAYEKISAPSRRKFLDKSSRGLGLIYILEALGAVGGGLLTSLFLIRALAPVPLIVILSALNLAAGGALLFSSSPGRSALPGKAIWLGLVGAGVVFFCAGGVGRLMEKSLAWQWRGFRLEKTENSIYGNLAITGRENQFSLFENGLLLFTQPDLLSAEESVHFAMLEHPDPRRVLLIGGGVGGSLREILKYPSLSKLTYMELDPAIIRLAGEFLPPEEVSFLEDPRVEVIYGDGRLFLQKETQKYDLIIINLPDPFTAQLNRFYTREFFALARDHLRKGGIISLGLTSSENYISGELQNFLGCIYKTLRKVFPALVIVPGGTNYFIASDTADYLTDDYSVLEERIRERGLDLKYVRSYYLADRMRRERIDYLRRKLETAPRDRLNLDFYPICYFYDMVFWSSYFIGETGGWFSRLLQGALSMRWWWFLLPVGLSLIFLPLFRARRDKSRGAWVLWPVMTSGFSEIVFQVVVLLAFQILYGYVYYKLGIILTLFMVGLVLGGGTITRLLPRLKDEHRLFFITQIVICLYPLLLPGVFYLLAANPGRTMIRFGENIIFPAFPVIAGFIGGFQLPLAGRIYLKSRKRLGMVSGLVYGFDLLGACLGALLISAFVLPIMGVAATCYAVTLLNLSSLVVIGGYKIKSHED